MYEAASVCWCHAVGHIGRLVSLIHHWICHHRLNQFLRYQTQTYLFDIFQMKTYKLI